MCVVVQKLTTFNEINVHINIDIIEYWDFLTHCHIFPGEVEWNQKMCSTELQLRHKVCRLSALVSISVCVSLYIKWSNDTNFLENTLIEEGFLATREAYEIIAVIR